MKYILGIQIGHDSAASLVVDGEIINDDIEEVYDEEFFSHDCEEVAS